MNLSLTRNEVLAILDLVSGAVEDADCHFSDDAERAQFVPRYAELVSILRRVEGHVVGSMHGAEVKP